MLFWKNYQYLCDKNKLSVYDVAKKCGIKSTATVSYWRQGSTPKMSVLNKMSQFFAVPIGDLLSVDLAALDTLNTPGAPDDPIYSAILKLTPTKRALVMAYISGLNFVSD